jgi:hypothetical protein
MTSRRRKKVGAIALVVVITLVLGACVGDDAGASQGTTKLANPTQSPAATGGAGTGPVETGPAVTGPAETADGGEDPEPPPLAKPAQLGTVTASGGGCALEIDVKTIRAGAGRLTVVNEKERSVAFDLFRLASEGSRSFERLEAFVASGKVSTLIGPFSNPPTGSFFLVERQVRPGASGAITQYFTTGDAFAVVCANPNKGSDFMGEENGPFALVGPIVVP